MRASAEASVQHPAWPERPTRFVVRFVAGTAGLLWLYHFPFAASGLLPRFMKASFDAYAQASGMLVRVFDPTVQVTGNVIAGRFSLSVSQGCDAIEIAIPLAVAMLSFPARAAHKILGVGLGLLAVATANVIRITSLYFAGIRSPELFELLHVDVWPIAFLAMAFLIFLLWARRANADSLTATIIDGTR